MFQQLKRGAKGATRYNNITLEPYNERSLSKDEKDGIDPVNDQNCFFRQGLTSRSGGESTRFPVSFNGKNFRPTAGGWRTGKKGMTRVLKASRVALEGKRLTFKKIFRRFWLYILVQFLVKSNWWYREQV